MATAKKTKKKAKKNKKSTKKKATKKATKKAKKKAVPKTPAELAKINKSIEVADKKLSDLHTEFYEKKKIGNAEIEALKAAREEYYIKEGGTIGTKDENIIRATPMSYLLKFTEENEPIFSFCHYSLPASSPDDMTHVYLVDNGMAIVIDGRKRNRHNTYFQYNVAFWNGTDMQIRGAHDHHSAPDKVMVYWSDSNYKNSGDLVEKSTEYVINKAANDVIEAALGDADV